MSIESNYTTVSNWIVAYQIQNNISAANAAMLLSKSDVVSVMDNDRDPIFVMQHQQMIDSFANTAYDNPVLFNYIISLEYRTVDSLIELSEFLDIDPLDLVGYLENIARANNDIDWVSDLVNLAFNLYPEIDIDIQNIFTFCKESDIVLVDFFDLGCLLYGNGIPSNKIILIKMRLGL